jgi:hypothetical protein
VVSSPTTENLGPGPTIQHKPFPESFDANAPVKPWSSKRRLRDLTHVLRRPVEVTAQLSLWPTEPERLVSPKETLGFASWEAEFGTKQTFVASFLKRGIIVTNRFKQKPGEIVNE